MAICVLDKAGELPEQALRPSQLDHLAPAGKGPHALVICMFFSYRFSLLLFVVVAFDFFQLFERLQVLGDRGIRVQNGGGNAIENSLLQPIKHAAQSEVCYGRLKIEAAL